MTRHITLMVMLSMLSLAAGAQSFSVVNVTSLSTETVLGEYSYGAGPSELLYVPGTGVVTAPPDPRLQAAVNTLDSQNCSGAQAFAVNASGQVTGSAYFTPSSNAPGNFSAFIYTPGTGTKDLGTLVPQSPYAASKGLYINDSGQVLGEDYSYEQQNTRSVLYTPGKPELDLGRLGMFTAIPTGLNDLGQAIGYSVNANQAEAAFLYTPGIGIQALADSYSTPISINDKGEVIGNGSAAIGNAFYYSASTGTVSLDSLLPANSGWVLNTAESLNERGQIVASGTFDGLSATALLSPVGIAPAVPEPSTTAMLILGTFGLSFAGWRRRRATNDTPVLLHSGSITRHR